ncbi:diguanylate cyclase [Bradyrhizobium pachyrhizi]|uniref:diguanylate cyclase n=1 Tax=Bradyrhizobium pachyrhizi TaxID=280333 RepID=A0A844SY34_9BRAD|nr:MULTISPECIES: GGDEF domain-containing protein [Bradyrhizobium]MVT70265.1 diguanylate cyclase [Bradyrhizobium pachyrhizi]PAY08700.1 GGDEF domain-containing protein [Bradyrhizobium sp. UFLA03-84]
MSTNLVVHEATNTLRLVTQAYVSLLLVAFALMPAQFIAYLFFQQDPALKFENHLFHEFAIAVATLEGLFVTYVTWRCYQASGEPLLRWLTLGFLGFVLIYSPHGAFTGMAHRNIWLFLLYGPASRLAMSILLFVGLFSYDQPSDEVEKRSDTRTWLMWIGLFLTMDIAVGLIAYSPYAGHAAVRLSMEGGALVFSALNVAAMLMRRIQAPLMLIFGISVAWFALSSLAFILAAPWNHMWWLAHAIFAGGFFLLSYGVAQAFRTTQSFSTIYSQEEMTARLAESMAETQRALQQLQLSNQRLERLAATDPLTGAGNRRHFIEQISNEITRAKRSGAPLSLLSIDLDHFKDINDSRGHSVGDEVLRAFVRKCLEAIRPYDSVARVGGEEFMVLLPGATLDAACAVAERLRSAIEGAAFDVGAQPSVGVTISVGVSEFGRDGDTLDGFLNVADQRLYRAKFEGRNRVIVG